MIPVEVISLKKSYGALKAVDGVSFSVNQGEVFALLGPNGAGKTTTIEILEGLRKKDEGTEVYSVLILGRMAMNFTKKLESYHRNSHSLKKLLREKR